jgi:glycosyltransferase involved in cell wall biosynthesis
MICVLLVIQIPCHNEADTLPGVVRELPRRIEGVEAVRVVVIDDGSTDGTAEAARVAGADHVIRHPIRRGLAAAFRSGIEYCRKAGADIVVNTDGDGQYRGADVAHLVALVVAKQADVVVGDRNPGGLPHFSPFKRAMQWLGSRIVSMLARTPLPDVTSGFRAYSRQAIMRLTIETSFSHSLETLVQATWKGLEVRSLPVDARQTHRRSRLSPSSLHFIARQSVTLLRVMVLYRPLTLFWTLGFGMIAIGAAPVIRFLWFYTQGDGGGHIQSLVIGGTLLMMGAACVLFGLLADQVNGNRRLLEDISERVRTLEIERVAVTEEEPVAPKKPTTAPKLPLQQDGV